MVNIFATDYEINNNFNIEKLQKPTSPFNSGILNQISLVFVCDGSLFLLGAGGLLA